MDIIEINMQLGLMKSKVSNLDSDLLDLENFEKFKDAIKLQSDKRTGNTEKMIDLYEIVRASKRAVEEANSENSSVRESALVVVDKIRHASNDFNQFANSARKFRDTCSELTSNAQENTLNFRREDIVLNSKLVLRSVGSEKHLRKLGGELDNCVKDEDSAKEYLKRATIGQSELWVLLSPNEETLALIEVNCEDRTISEFDCLEQDGETVLDEGNINQNRYRARRKKHDSIKKKGVIYRNDLVEILNKLNASADDVPEFVLLGAFSKFKNGVPTVEPVALFDGREMWVWKYADEFIVGLEADGVNDDRAFNWSRFKRDTSYRSKVYWTESTRRQHLDVEDLLEVLISNPHAFEKLTADSLA